MALMSEAFGTAPIMVSIFLPSLKIMTYNNGRKSVYLHIQQTVGPANQ